MGHIGVPLIGFYDDRLVVVSILIAILTSYVALDLALRVTAASGMTRHTWWAGGAVSMGLGIWSMHFVGMLAFRLPIPVLYHLPTVLISLLAAILASAVALHIVSARRLGRREALVGSLVMGGGIAAMHYLGMAAMRFPATCHYNPLLVGLSILIPVATSLAALTFTLDFHEEPRGTWAKGTSAAVMGVAIVSMHYVGMASASFANSDLAQDFSHAVSISRLGIAGIVIVTLMILGFTLLTTFMDRQFAAQALQVQSSEQLVQQSRALIDAIPQQIWSGPPDGTLDYCNAVWRSYVGLDLEELQGDGWQKMLHPDDRDRVLKAWHESVVNGTPYEQEERHRGVDGQYRWFLARGVPLRDAGGRIFRWYGTNTDIEDLKRAEEARRQSEEQYRIVVETATDAIVSIDADSQLLFVNPATTKIFGYESSELIGRPLTMLMPESLRELHKAGLQRYLTTGQRHMNWQGVELIGLRKNREEFPVEVSIGAVVKQGHHIFTGFVRDITDRKQAEEELRQLSGRLLRSQDEERRRIARELHDSTGQDLVALATMLGQLRGSIPSVERKSRGLLSECKALAERCIREVRTLSYVLHPPVLDAAGLSDAIRDYVDGFTKRSGIQVELELSPHVGRQARDVELALFRVVQEALTNIQRHSGSQRAKIRIHRNSDLTLEIGDLGRGFSASVPRGKEELRFELGVGIPSMQERVKLIGGRLDIDSTSHGTTVRVTIPLGGKRN
jgi:PAS domain S-box-containing protein